jgi:RES domain-containing protein
MGKLLLKFWRLVHPKHGQTIEEAFSGNGGLYTHARWHFKGTRIVYCATSIALALLEILVHWIPPQGRSLCLYRVEIAEDLISVLKAEQFPKDWRQHPPSVSTMRIGTDWIKAQSSLGFIVPSAIVPEEQNCLLNPVHPLFSQVQITGPSNYELDSRL